MTSPWIIKTLANERFVFGSNLAGRHGAGAALTARLKFGAEIGVGVGPTGQCYAIPTKSLRLASLSLERIKSYVHDFILYARANPDLRFLVTPVGCGMAGYSPEDIAPFFDGAPENVLLPEAFLPRRESK